MRFGLRKSLEKYANLKVVGDVSNGLDGVEQARELQPQVVLMDIGLPVLNGIDATREIKTHFSDIKVIMLTTFDDEHRTCGALAAGADAYCSKSIKTPDLVNVMQKVISGSGWLDSTVARHVVKLYSIKSDGTVSGGGLVGGGAGGTVDGENVDSGNGLRPSSDATDVSAETSGAASDEDPALSLLTNRELELLRMLMVELDDDEIAMRLNVDAETVYSSIRSLLKKLADDEKTQSYLAHLQRDLGS